MTTPIDKMLDAVDWEILPPQAPEPDGTPHATHHGFLRIGDAELECYVLSDGRRIFTADSIERFFGAK